MKSIYFKKLLAQNFLSIGKQQELEFRPGITSIYGYNHDRSNDGNGVGKSTIAEVINFALFGNTIKDLKKEEIVNRIAKKDCVVELTFVVNENGKDDEYVISRGISPSYCKLYKNGKDITLSGIPATNQAIVDLICTTEQMFQNTVMMTSEKPPFMKMRKNERREFIEGVFSLSFLREMNKMVKQESDALGSEFKTVNEKLDMRHNDVDNYKLKRTATLEAYERESQARKERIEKYRRDLEILEHSRYSTISPEELQDINTKLGEAETKLKEAESERLTLRGDYAEVSSEIKTLEDKISQQESYAAETARMEDEVEKKCRDEGYNIKDVVDTDLDLLRQTVRKAEDNVKTCTANRDRLVYDVENLRKQADELMNLGNVCETCKRPFDNVDMESRNNKIKELESLADIKEEHADTLSKNIEDDSRYIRNTTIRIDKFANIKFQLAKLTGRTYYDIDSEKAKLPALREKRIRISDNGTALNDSINNLNDEISKLKLRVSEDTQNRIKNDGIASNIRLLKEQIRTCEEEANKPQTALQSIDDLITGAVNEIAELETNAAGITHKIDVYALVKYILSDDGFRAYMVKKYVSTLNGLINKYLEQLDAPMQMMFDEYFEDKIEDLLTGTECSYASLSCGEKKRLDLAVMLALMDILNLQGKVKFNFCFYDEILDSALSADACGRLISIINTRLNEIGENAMLITHKREIQQDERITNTLIVEKIGGVSSFAYGSKQQ